MWKWLESLMGKETAPSVPPEPPPCPLLDELLAQALPAATENQYLFEGPVLKDHPAGRAILELDPGAQVDLVIEVFGRYAASVRRLVRTHNDQNVRWALPKIASQLLRRKLPFEERHLLALAKVTGLVRSSYVWSLPIPGLVRALEEHVQAHGLSKPLRAAFHPLLRDLDGYLAADQRRLLERLDRLLRQEGPQEPRFKLRGGDAWSDALIAELDGMEPEAARAWRGLLAHCAAAGSARPSAKWLGQAQKRMAEVAPAELSRIVALCLGRLGQPGSRRQRSVWLGGNADPAVLDDTQTDLLRGLVWCAGLADDPGLVPVVGDAAQACFRKVANHGPLNVKIGNACLDTLSRLGTPEAVAQLSRLRARVQHPSSKRQLEAALSKAAERQGLTAGELEEISVPVLGLTEVGLRRETLGGFEAELRITGTASTELVWRKAGARAQKSVPKAVKEEHSDELKALTAAAKEIQKVLPGQRDRLERLYVHPRGWDLATWRERYLDHPLVGALARRLVWRFDQSPESRTGLWRDGEIVDAEGRPLAGLDGARVALWHPLDSRPDQVLAWRRALEEWEVVQPFKQAHREVYILTDAERRTHTYSNRFAAHILKQHQLAALCRQRGWSYSLQGQFDSWNAPTRLLPEHDLRVELWVEAVPHEAHVTQMGIFLYVSTDQVRFCDPTGEPRPLELIPPHLFTELMRDVDLFVGVCSVGNDPAWGDQGERPGLHYWHTYSFGDLGESARTRRELLERLVPRLKIAGRCALTERFLVVRGDLRTYKIHLGSGNILMEPDDQYLCIVRDASKPPAGSHTILPFEGDGTLSVILSKAFLLAEDRKITDPTIVRQLRR